MGISEWKDNQEEEGSGSGSESESCESVDKTKVKGKRKKQKHRVNSKIKDYPLCWVIFSDLLILPVLQFI